MYQKLFDPPKSPVRRGTLRLFSPFLRGASLVLGVPEDSCKEGFPLGQNVRPAPADWRGLGGISIQLGTLQTSSKNEE